MKKKILYLLSPNIKWKTFKLLQKRMVKDSGIVVMNFDRILWELLKEERIMCGFVDDMPNDLWISSIDIPKRYKDYEIKVII